MKRLYFLFLGLVISIGLVACDEPINDEQDDNNQTDNEVTYTVSFNVHGGSMIEAIQVNEGSTISLPLEPTKTGYQFVGWFVDADYQYPFSPSATIFENITLHAKWEAISTSIEESTISFNANGGSSVSSITQEVGTSLPSLPTPTKEGYTFIGWYTTSALTTEFNSSTMPSSNITLYAKWEQNQTDPDEATISFNTNGGSSVSSITQEVGTSLPNLPTPTKEGYTFIGWYTTSALTTEFTDTTMPSSNMTLYAKWEQNQTEPDEATISFNTNGGSSVSPITQEVGTSLPSLPTPNKEGYTFIGWYTTSALTTSFTDSTMPSSDITLYAKWEALTTPLDLLVETLEDLYEFSCTQTTCTYLVSSSTYYTFNISDLTFSFTSITDEGGSSNYRQLTETTVINASYQATFTYELEEDYGIYYYTNFTYTGNSLTASYQVTRFSSNYQAESTLIAKGDQRINQLKSFLDIILDDAGVTFDDLS